MADKRIPLKGSIKVKALSKHFGTNKVLQKISFSVEPGECLGIAGSNGCGKTTLIKLLSTLSLPTKGTIHISGFDANKDGVEVRSHIGLISHHALLYEELSAMENLVFFARLHDIEDHEAEKRGKRLLRKVGLGLRENDTVGTFSKGMVQRLSIAKTFMSDPDVLLLDEPFSSLDQGGIELLCDMMDRHLGSGGCILLTSHQLDRLLHSAQSIRVLGSGKLGQAYPASSSSRTHLERSIKGGSKLI